MPPDAKSSGAESEEEEPGQHEDTNSESDHDHMMPPEGDLRLPCETNHANGEGDECSDEDALSSGVDEANTDDDAVCNAEFLETAGAQEERCSF